MLMLASGVGFAQRHGGGFGHHGFPGDTVRPPHGPKDTLRGGPLDSSKFHPKGPGPGGNFGLKDSCFRVFLSQIPADSAAMITNDLNTIRDDQAQADTLKRQLFAAWKAHDTTAVKAIRAQLAALQLKTRDAAQNLKAILDQYKDLLMTIRKDCSGLPNPPHKGGPGSGGGAPALMVTPVIPNPVPTGAQAAFLYQLTAAADVNITISDMMGTVVKTVFTGNVTDLTPQKVTLDLSGLKPGVYILRVQAGNDVMSQKIMVM